jgi:hypothetical protein
MIDENIVFRCRPFIARTGPAPAELPSGSKIMIGGLIASCSSGCARAGRVVSHALPCGSIVMPETNGTLKFAGILGQFGSTSKTGSGRAGFAAG